MKKQIKVIYQELNQQKTKTFDVEIQIGEELGQIVNFYMNTGIVEQTENKITVIPPCNIRKIEFDPRIDNIIKFNQSNGIQEVGEASEKDILNSLAGV